MTIARAFSLYSTELLITQVRRRVVLPIRGFSILSTLDVVVVPSLWYENSPFTIQEAFQAGLPVITSNAGGMSELVRDGIEGLQFQIGNAADLRRAMRSLLDDPGQLERFRQNLPDLPTLEGQAALVRRQYEALLGNRWHNTIGDTTSGP